MGKEIDIENKADDEINNKTKNKTEQNNITGDIKLLSATGISHLTEKLQLHYRSI